ncbi:MAG: carbon storage regulator CsrA [Lachnospiraceae bacterium]|nr:carbon storage regulator CsrA [Lachnospiraceae bacterium]
MLALSRKKNEAIVLNNNIEITILEIKGEQVKLGISAPKNIPVYRKEVYVQIQEANTAAINTDGMDALKDLLG